MSLITQFYPNRAVDGNTGDSSFGRVLRAADPLIGQIAAKANFQQERGRLGRASRANGTGIDNSDVALHKLTNFTSSFSGTSTGMFNVANRAQFYPNIRPGAASIAALPKWWRAFAVPDLCGSCICKGFCLFGCEQIRQLDCTHTS